MPSRETYEHGRDKHVAFFVSSKHMFVHKRNVMEQPQRQQQFLWAFIQVSLQLLFLFCALKKSRVYLLLSLNLRHKIVPCLDAYWNASKKALRSQGDGHQGHTTSATTLKKPCKSTCYLKVTRTHHWMIYTEMHVCPMYMYIMLIHGGVYVYSTYTQWCVHRNFQSSNAQDRTTQYKTVQWCIWWNVCVA